MAIVVQTESRGKPQSPVRRQIPRNDWSEVVGSFVKPKVIAVAQAAIKLETGDEILAAKAAALCGGLQGQRAACTQRISEFPRITAGQVLGGQGIKGDVPSIMSARQQDLEFKFVVVFETCEGVWDSMVGLDVVTLDFFNDLVGFVDLLVFDIEHRIHRVLALEQAKAVFQAESSKERAVVEGGMGVDIEFGGPPGGCAIFEFHPIGDEVTGAALGAVG